MTVHMAMTAELETMAEIMGVLARWLLIFGWWRHGHGARVGASSGFQYLARFEVEGFDSPVKIIL